MMIQKSDIIATIKKYGFDGKSDPCLYEKNNEYGIYYTVYDRVYGFLSRIKTFSDIDELDKFLYMLWWLRKNSYNKDVRAHFLNYEDLDIELEIYYKGTLATIDELKDLDEKSYSNKFQDDKNIYSKMLRSAKLLFEVIKEKKLIIENTFKNATSMVEEYNKNVKNLVSLYLKLTRDNLLIEEINLNPVTILTDEEINRIEKELNKYENDFLGLDSIKAFVESLWYYVKNLEADDNYLNHRYSVIKIPVMIDDVKKQYKVLEEMKKTFFSFLLRRDDVIKEFKEVKLDAIDIVSYEIYKQNELNRLDDKYSVIENIDYKTAGDYLIEFDNLSVNQGISAEVLIAKKFTEEEIVENLVEQYGNLPKEKQMALVQYHSLLKPVIKEIMNYKINEIDKIIELLKNNAMFSITTNIMNILDHPDNIMLKLKYFKDIKTNNIENFITSLLAVINIIRTINNFYLLGDLKVYFKSADIPFEEEMIDVSLLPEQAPSQKKGLLSVDYILNLYKADKILFLPLEININYEADENHMLKVYMNHQGIAYFPENILINELKFDIIRINRYEKVVSGNKVINMKLKTTSIYKIQKERDFI